MRSHSDKYLIILSAINSMINTHIKDTQRRVRTGKAEDHMNLEGEISIMYSQNKSHDDITRN